MIQVLAYIGLGGNLEQPVNQLERALHELDQIPRSCMQTSSSFYLSSPMGPVEQPDYVNAVAAVQTELSPVDLLDELQQIEQAHGRVPGLRWGPRTLDLDLLLYGDQFVRDDRLSVPHPGIIERAFVLLPLAELAPRLEIPGLGAISDALAACDTRGTKTWTP